MPRICRVFIYILCRAYKLWAFLRFRVFFLDKMSQIEKECKNEAVSLKKHLHEMPTNMHLFSLSMRYAEQAVGTSTKAAQKFRQLRDDTRQHAMVYLKCILPITTKFVMVLKDYFATYEALSYEEWCEMLPDILEETTSHKELAQTVVKMHEDLIVPLKKREDEAKIIMREFKDLQAKYEKEKQRLEGEAKSNSSWAAALQYIPVLNFIVVPVLNLVAEGYKVKAVAKDAEAEIQGAAALIVAETLIPALSNFIDGLTKAAGFFQVMEMELQSFVESTSKSNDSPKRLHHLRMKNEANDLKSLCQAFYAVLPAVRTDYEAIPIEGTDQNFVDKWLKEQLAAIAKKRSKIQKILLGIFEES